MSSGALILLAVPVFAALSFIFGRNAYKGFQTGKVWVKGASYIRSDEPVLFWIGVGFSTAFTVFCFAAILLAFWAAAVLT